MRIWQNLFIVIEIHSFHSLCFRHSRESIEINAHPSRPLDASAVTSMLDIELIANDNNNTRIGNIGFYTETIGRDHLIYLLTESTKYDKILTALIDFRILLQDSTSFYCGNVIFTD